MRSDNGAFQHAHKPSDTARSVQSNASTTTEPYPRTSAQSNVTNSIFSQSSTSTALTAQSSTESIEPSSSNHRDSFGSILDDPFFQTYDPALVDADAASDASEDSSHYHSLDDDDNDPYYHRDRDHNRDPDSDENISNQRWPPPRRESLTVGTSSYWVCFPNSPEIEQPPTPVPVPAVFAGHKSYEPVPHQSYRN